MKKILLLIISVISLSLIGCGSTEIFIVDGNISTVPGIIVSVSQTTTKETVSEARSAKYNALGELDTITILITGTISKTDCNTNAVPMVYVDKEDNPSTNWDNIVNVRPIKSNETAAYYTAFFTLKIKMPKDASKVSYTDGNFDDEPGTGTITNGYYTEQVQWLLNKGINDWTICGNETFNTGLVYMAFVSNNNIIIQQYMIKIIYNITFIA